MSKTRAQLRTHARMFLDEVSEADWSDSQINTELNYAYMEVYTAVIETYEDYYKTDLTASFSASTASYALPDDFFKVRRLEVRMYSTDEYVKATPYSFDQIGTAVDTTSLGLLMRPIYELSGSYLRILPLPPSDTTGGYRLTYIAQATEMDDDNDTINIPFPDRYGKLVVKGAVSQLLSKGQQEEVVASKYFDEFQIGLEKMKNELKLRYADGVAMVQDTLGGYNDFGNSSVITGIQL